MGIRQTREGLLLECDGCSNYLYNNDLKTFKEVSDFGKENGWICRKINDQWFNFCSEECYQNKKAELEVGIGQEEQPKEKWQIFETEINYIKEDGWKQLAKWLISQLPNYFFEVAASSTGKYHPQYALGKGGLVRHTKAAVRFAVEMLRLEQNQGLNQAHDPIIIALLLHDGWKHGEQKEDGSYSQYTVFKHPKVCADWLRQVKETVEDLSTKSALDFIASLVESHMGEWNMNYQNGAVELPKPVSPTQQFVHLCDYLASRKCFEFDESVEFVS